MLEVKIYSTSKEYVLARVLAKVSGSVIDPTIYPAEMAFTQSGQPVTADWLSATWETNTTTTQATYYARVMIGPGSSKTLAAGRWVCWVRLTATPEIPVISPGTVVIK